MGGQVYALCPEVSDSILIETSIYLTTGYSQNQQ